MRIIEIIPLSNGAHRNQSTTLRRVPDGWAIVPDTITVPSTFPFVDITVENGVVTSMTPGVVPEPEPEPAPEPTPQDDTDALVVDHELRITMLELGLTE